MAHADLIGHWKMDDNAATPTVLEEVAGLNGTMSVNTDTVTNDGNIGTSLNFADTHTVTVDNPAPLLGINEFTVSGWIRNPIFVTEGDHWGDTLLSWTNGTHQERISLELYLDGLASYSDGDAFTGNSYMSEELAWEADTWYHIAFTQQLGGAMQMYRDGNLLGYRQNPPNRPVPSQIAATQVEIGCLLGGDNLHGSLDDVQLYDEQLDGDQIAFLAANPGSPIPEPGTLLLLASGLISLLIWRRRN